MSKDPTRTLMIRREASREINRRFNKLKKLVREALKDGKALGINTGLLGNEALDTDDFVFMREAEKLQAFDDWFRAEVFKEVLQGDKYSDDHWLIKRVGVGYERGAKKARAAALKKFPTLAGVNEYSPLLNPNHVQRAELIFTRTFEDLKGVSNTMADQVRRELAKGMLEGQGPIQVAKAMEDRIDKIGKTRSQLIARTEIIESHNSAVIQEAENLEDELDEVANVEWIATLDSRVRDSHQHRHGNVYSRQDGQRMIGEPNCRCSLAISFEETS